jgi:hypothetical protein
MAHNTVFQEPFDSTMGNGKNIHWPNLWLYLPFDLEQFIGHMHHAIILRVENTGK